MTSPFSPLEDPFGSLDTPQMQELLIDPYDGVTVLISPEYHALALLLEREEKSESECLPAIYLSTKGVIQLIATLQRRLKELQTYDLPPKCPPLIP